MSYHAYNYLPKKVLKALPEANATKNTPIGNVIVGAHYFFGAFDFWAIEYDREREEFFGIVRWGGYPEAATFTLKEMQKMRISMNIRLQFAGTNEIKELRTGMPIERELHWTPKPLYEVLPDTYSQTVMRIEDFEIRDADARFLLRPTAGMVYINRWNKYRQDITEDPYRKVELDRNNTELLDQVKEMLSKWADHVVSPDMAADSGYSSHDYFLYVNRSKHEVKV